MKYYIHEFATERNDKIAMGKAREDVNDILQSIDFQPVKIPVRRHEGIHKIARQFLALHDWRKALSQLMDGDALLIQYPPLENSIFLAGYLKSISQRGLKIILLVHDAWIVHENRTWKGRISAAQERKILKASQYIIVHNPAMGLRFEEEGIAREKLIELSIFDYMVSETALQNSHETEHQRTQPIVIAGNLSKWKAAYLSELPGDCEFNLYGIGFSGSAKPNIHYQGSFMPDDLPKKMHGSFGLVWDGDSAKTCSGKTGEYLRFNNPHKTSLYLACGIPVIIWEQAAMADFILKNHCGITVKALEDISGRIRQMTDERYAALKRNAEKIGIRLRAGYYLKRAMHDITLRGGLS